MGGVEVAIDRDAFPVARGHSEPVDFKAEVGAFFDFADDLVADLLTRQL